MIRLYIYLFIYFLKKKIHVVTYPLCFQVPIFKRKGTENPRNTTLHFHAELSRFSINQISLPYSSLIKKLVGSLGAVLMVHGEGEFERHAICGFHGLASRMRDSDDDDDDDDGRFWVSYCLSFSFLFFFLKKNMLFSVFFHYLLYYQNKKNSNN